MRRVWLFLVFASTLIGTTHNVTTTGINTTDPTTLPYWLLNAGANDIIDCSAIAGGTITLSGAPLPTIVQQGLTVTAGDGSPVAINGNSQGFSVVADGVTINNFTMTNCLSRGGDGGLGTRGGGGGAAGGPALYLHQGRVTITHFTATNNTAQGGMGGLSSSTLTGGGGGGGGFGNSGSSNGGQIGGGGGGGGPGGGNGGSDSSTDGFAGIFFGGGGGGSQGKSGGNSATGFSGGGAGFSNGGGGAGAGGNGNSATSAVGGLGGVGLGSDQYFGGGGGGSGYEASVGGNGFGMGGGGGGGAGSSIGGAGGVFGGGGGGSGIFGPGGGGQGGFGGGGGASGNSTGGSSLFGGGSGGAGNGASGGGGAALGGAIFIHNLGSLTISDGCSWSGNQVIGGTSPGTSGSAGGTFGQDIFLQSGGTITFNLSGSLTLSNPIISDEGIGGGVGGGILVEGTGTVIFPAGNTYTGTVQILSGVMQIVDDTSFGVASNTVSITNGTLQLGQNFTTAKTFAIGGAATINTQGYSATFPEILSGSGSIALIGSGGSVTFSANNTYVGGNTIGNGVSLYGNTTTIPGSITFNASNSSVTFNQTENVVYGEILNGPGSLNIQGSTMMEFTGDSLAFTGALNIPLGTTLIMNGSFDASSTTTIPNGATITGTGYLGNLINDGAISPGNSIGTLHVTGDLTLTSNSFLTIEIKTNSNDVIDVRGTATLDGDVYFVVPYGFMPGFFSFGGTFVFLTSSSIIDAFSSYSFSQVGVVGTIQYLNGQDAALVIPLTDPFIGFPFSNQNTRAVGENLEALNAAGELDDDLINITNNWIGVSDAQINAALDQMHPAPYSALLDIQAQVGGQIVSLFHRKPALFCNCSHKTHLWAEPMGNWLNQGNLGQQVGFHAFSQGIAIGADFELLDSFVLGFGGVWNQTELTWKKSIGSGMVQRALGAIYMDYNSDDFYFGLSFLAGTDDQRIRRHLDFPGADFYAHGNFRSLDMMGQLSFAYFFGNPMCLLYPYANFDVFYLKAPAFTEHRADGLDLQIAPHKTSTVRGEAGIALQVKDTNYYETICISPLVKLGWAMECPIYRPTYTANFINEPISFEAHGWNQTWQLLSLSFGLKITYRSVSLSVDYVGEMTPEGRDEFWGQRCNIGLELFW